MENVRPGIDRIRFFSKITRAAREINGPPIIIVIETTVGFVRKSDVSMVCIFFFGGSNYLEILRSNIASRVKIRALVLYEKPERRSRSR